MGLDDGLRSVGSNMVVGPIPKDGLGLISWVRPKVDELKKKWAGLNLSKWVRL